MQAVHIPICPITQNPVQDPVICPDGHTYERAAIAAWLQNHNTSPLNPALHISLQDLVPNYALRQMIEDMNNGNGSGNVGNNQNNVAVDVSPTIYNYAEPTLSMGKVENDYVVTVKNPDIKDRLPRDVVCVIDISGSMGQNVSIKTSQGQGENHGLSVLDVVKHAVLTVATSLNQIDRMAIVVFDDSAVVNLELTEMSTFGKAAAKTSIKKIQTGGCTNLHAGISKGLELLRNRIDTTREGSVLVFTDGVPNQRPTRGEDYELKKYKDSHRDCPTVHTFGFANNLMSDLLYELCEIGNGMFCYIPDASFVGTIFVNALSNILSTYANNAELTVGGRHFTLGPLQYGQDKTVVFNGEAGDISLSFDQKGQRRIVTSLDTFVGNFNDDQSARSAVAHKYFVQGVRTCINYVLTGQYGVATDNLASTINLVKNAGGDTAYTNSLVQDLSIQIREALSQEYFKTWGQHFLYSILRAHQLQYCNNFKDPGVQHYGGEMFHELQNQIDGLFNDIPPPEPSNSTTRSVAVHSMAYYNDSSNPCFSGWCTAKTPDGLKTLEELRSGDMVDTLDGPARIVCILKTYCKDGKANLVSLDSGLVVTAFHPIFHEGAWVFPKDVGEVKNIECQAVYSFVLERDHRMLINNTPCICLGHGYTEGILDHHYYGTRAVVDDLMKMPGWDEGLVQLRSGCIKANEHGLVEGLVHNYMPG